MTKIVIIHPGIYSNSINNTLIESFTPDVVPIRYTYEMTKEDILKQINGPITHLAFLYHYQGNCVLPFFELCKADTNGNLIEPAYIYFSDTIIDIITAARNLYTGSDQLIVDLLSCNLNVLAFKDEVRTIENNINVDIRYSVDLTGNSTNGANWVLESDAVNVQSTYFTDNVLAWTGVLAAGDITAAIKSGTYSSYITWNPATSTYSVQKSFAWSELGLSDTPTGSYINALGGETIEGNNYIIDLTGYGNWNGLCNNGDDVAPGFTVQNLGFINGDSLGSGGYFVRRYCVAYTVRNCFSTGSIGQFGGGIAGSYINLNNLTPRVCTITNCFSNGYMNNTWGGGIVGESFGKGAPDFCIISNCYSTGNITEAGGGIAAYLAGANGGLLKINNCYSFGSIAKDGGGITGGRSGYLGVVGNVIISNCYSLGDITGEGGGIAGFVSTVTLNNCYSTGTIASSAGGLVGRQSSSTFNNCVCNGTPFSGSGSTETTTNCSSTLSSINGTIYSGWDSSIWASGGSVSGINLPILTIFQNLPWLTNSSRTNLYYSAANIRAMYNVYAITITDNLRPLESEPVNTNFTYTITATGFLIQYRWYKNGVLIPGQTTASLSFTPLQVSDGANYYVNVYNIFDSVNSITSTLEIQTVPVITIQPQNTTVPATQTANFQVISTGNALQYEWRFNGVPISGGPNSFSISINNCQPSNEGTYSVRVFNLAGSVLSNNATLTVTIDPPTITTQPQSLKQQVGLFASLIVVSTPSYNQFQWYKNGVPVINGTLNYLVFNPLTFDDVGSYYVKVYNSAGYVFSNTVTVDVYDTPRVTQQPLSFYEVGLNGQIRFCAQVYGGCLHYQWQKDGIDLPGEDGTCLTISNAQYDQAGQYRLCATNPAGTVCTDYTTVYVNPVPQTCFPFETPAGGLAGGGNLASGLTDMKIGRAQECYVRDVLPLAHGNNCCLTAGPQISPYAGGTTSGALLQKQMEAQALCNISTNIAVAKLQQYIQPCPVISNDGVDLRFVKYHRRGPMAAPTPPPPGVFIPNNPAIPKATDGYCVPIIGITQSRF